MDSWCFRSSSSIRPAGAKFIMTQVLGPRALEQEFRSRRRPELEDDAIHPGSICIRCVHTHVYMYKRICLFLDQEREIQHMTKEKAGIAGFYYDVCALGFTRIGLCTRSSCHHVALGLALGLTCSLRSPNDMGGAAGGRFEARPHLGPPPTPHILH